MGSGRIQHRTDESRWLICSRFPCIASDISSARSNTCGEDLKGSVSPSRQHNTASHATNFYVFLAFIAFIACGASAAAFLVPFFAMLLNTGKLRQWGMQVSSKTSFHEPDGRTRHHTMHHNTRQW